MPLNRCRWLVALQARPAAAGLVALAALFLAYNLFIPWTARWVPDPEPWLAPAVAHSFFALLWLGLWGLPVFASRECRPRKDPELDGLALWMHWIPGGAVFLALIAALFSLFNAEPSLPPLLSWGFLATVVWVPVVEEIVFRGILARQLLGNAPAMVAILYSAVIFMAAHGRLYEHGGFLPVDFIQWGPLFLGLATGALVVHGRRLGPAIFLHMCCNATGYVLPWLDESIQEVLRWLYL